ncbi:proline--tRNA ligase [Pseudalkalibacillus caeni]|uniref:Proline--tRNA ligase n=1 Tax=Exobacillus caeni TaxID=2574798 RepID=A0A5R9F4U2_9BACL|nr:proline--tRNA ligase [Pseudalkalibacillus caeni]TLS37366.1 proline--tRNA ligase [Pseudalkalibacillus caeni]
MKQSHYFNPTLRELPADAEVISHQLLLRAGYMRQNAAGIYSYLPLGKRVLRKIEDVIREELDSAGAQELLMPAIQPAELWQETGRWEVYGPELMRLKDRHDRPFALGATHEELITSLVRDELNSYKQMPVILYQIQTKYRDERRPRFGLLRGREFIMKDAYSFHSSQEQLDDAYRLMHETYSKIFTRLGLDFRPVVADSGAMGGKDTEEFMALSKVGEDTIAYSDSSDYAANIEMTEVHVQYEKSGEPEKELEKTNSVAEVGAEKIIKFSAYRSGEERIIVLVRGDHEINEVKVKHLLEVEMLEEIHELEGLNPVGVSGVKVVADNAVKSVVNGICRLDKELVYHNVNPERDIPVDTYTDIRFIKEGDPSPDGKGTIKFAEGIEVGQVFKLGTKYSEAMGANYLDENGKAQPIIMGCYGIGVSRVMASVAEQMHDDNGLLWPKTLAPFQVHLIAVNVKDEAQNKLGEELYEKLKSEKYDVLYDDRKERAGVKFKDSDLIGIPLRVVIGKKAGDGIVEVKVRKTGETFEVDASELESTLKRLWDNLD